MSPSLIALGDDLIFRSRIEASAQALGLEFRSARDQSALLRMLDEAPARCLILDLANPGLQLVELMERIKQLGASAPRVVAYGSHIHADVLHSAREAGCDSVLPRSKFVEDLEKILAAWTATGEAQTG